MIKTVLQDVHYGVRMLIKHRGFTAVAVLTLALGIGANTAIFSVVNTVLLRPLPYPEPEQLVRLGEKDERWRSELNPISSPNLKDWREQSRSFAYVCAYEYESFILTGRDEPERVVGLRISAGFLKTMGVPPAIGRDFLPEEDRPGTHRVVILSDGLWQRRLAGDPQAIGQTLTLGNESYTVVGVMPPGFGYPEPRCELWTPLALPPAKAEARSDHFLHAIARLKPGVTVTQARSELDTIARRLEQQYPETNTGVGAIIVPLHDHLVKNVRLALLVLLGAVGFVLLIACSNVATLLLAQAAVRQRELAIRAALGASRRRLISQLLSESVVLSLLGGGLGLLLSFWGVDLLLAVTPGGLYNAKAIGVDARVLGFTLSVSLLTGLIFGLAPALQASKPHLHESLRGDGRGGGIGRPSQRLRDALVVAEIVLALVLLTGGGLLMRSFWNLQRIDPGFDVEHVLTMQLALPEVRYKGAPQQVQFIEQVLERVAALPGVVAVGATTELPFSGSRTGSSFEIEGHSPSERGQSLHADQRTVSADYFRAMGIRLLRGRTFTVSDSVDAPRVALINNTAARRFWPGEDPVGQRVILRRGLKHEVVGVVADVKHEQLTEETRPEIYTYFLQARLRTWMDLAVRLRGEPEGLTAAVRRAIRAIDPDQPVYNLRTMEQRLARSIVAQRFSALLLGLFAAVALALATVGLYGVMAYLVAQRTHEIGVRMALGAQAGDVLKLVIRQGIMLALTGVAMGLAASLALTRLMKSLLFGVSATDPATFAVVSLILVGVALGASYLPARRATKVDPLVALRYE